MWLYYQILFKRSLISNLVEQNKKNIKVLLLNYPKVRIVSIFKDRSLLQFANNYITFPHTTSTIKFPKIIMSTHHYYCDYHYYYYVCCYRLKCDIAGWF